MPEVPKEQKHQVIIVSSSANYKLKNIIFSKMQTKQTARAITPSKNPYQQQLRENFCKMECT